LDQLLQLVQQMYANEWNYICALFLYSWQTQGQPYIQRIH
jgi:hypothetical protein